MKTTVVLLLSVAGFVGALPAVEVTGPVSRTISLEDFRDRMQGAWIGQSVGVAYGWPTEFICKGSIIPEDKMPVWKPESINETFSQDDLYVEMTFIKTLLDHGVEVSSRVAGVDFANSAYRLWCANHNARNNLRNGIAAPDSSHPKFHPTTDDIDYQIEADYSGILAPGMPQAAVDLGETFGRIMNYGDGLYAGQFVGAMYAEAYFITDRVEVVERALKAIPAESKYAEMVRDMVKWYRTDPKDWRGAWRKAVDKYQSPEMLGKVSFKEIDVKINGAMALLGFLFGEGDMDRTMYIATAGGYDSDCNPSTACGVLGTMIGYRQLDAKFRASLSETKKWEFTEFDWKGLVAASEILARQLVVKYGGEIVKDASGKEIFKIPARSVRPSSYFDSKTPGPLSGDDKLTAAERELIRYLPCDQQGGQSALRKSGPAAELRSPDVPFIAKNVKRIPAKPAVVGSSVTFGDRRIVLEPGQIVYSADGAKRFQLWHNFNHTVDGKAVYLRADEATAKCEATENGVTMTTRLFEGEKEVGQVLKTARLTADGDLVVTYRHTCPKGYMPIYNLRLYTTQMLGQTIGYNGKSVTLPNDLPGYKKFRSPDCGSPFTRFDCATNVAAVGFTLAMSGVESQYSRTDVNDFDVRLFPMSDDAELVFTFRPVESSTPPDACILSGINFTANDNVRVYVPDPKRNLCMDPSFESKMRRTYNRYSAPIYTNANGRLVEQDVRAISDRPICVGTARTGRYSLRPGYGNWLLANNVPLQKEKTYVMSFYVRSDDGKKAVYSSTRRNENGFHPVNFRGEVTDWSAWTRVVSEPFVAGARNDINLGGSKNLLVDDVQIEEGTEATPFVSGTLGFEMVADSPGETVCDAAFNYRPRVRVSGDRTLKGTLRLTGRDFFDRQLFVKDVPLTLGETAEMFVDLPETKDLPLGPTYVNLEVDTEGRGEFVYRDTVRLIKVVRPPEHAKHRFFFAALESPHICTTKEQLDLLGLLFRHGHGFWVKDEKDVPLLDPNLMISMKGTWNYDPKSGPNWKFYEGDFLFSDWKGQNMWKATEYPDAFLKDLEDAMAKYAAAHPWYTHWFHRREDNGIGSLQAGRMDEFAKYIAAIHRGVKRGNPAATMEGIGHCSHADEGVQYLVPFLKESKRLFPDLKYHAVCAHPYCAHPEIPDLDKTLGALIRNVSEVAGPDIKFVFDEGGYYVSQTMPERSFTPWAPTSDKDMAGGEQRFSRDAGWAEHVAAAMHMRYMVMMYKYIDRVIDHREWAYLGGDEPYAWTAMNSAFHRLLGDAEFADNFEFAPAARVYFFRDGHGRFIAIPWLFSREMDYGREEGQRMFLDLKGLHPEFVDIMGNVCTTKEKDGIRDLPLNNYPYYVIVPEAEAEQLKDAFRKVEYTPKADVIPFHIATKPLSSEAFEVTLTNPFATEKRIAVKIGEEAAQEIALAPGKPVTLRAKFPEISKDGIVNDYAVPIAVTWNGATSHESLLMRTWNVKKVGAGPVDWTKIPAVRLAGKMPKSWKGPTDFSSLCRLAWREGELLLRTETSDDVFVPSPAETKKGRSWFFESTQVFVDAFGNGRENLRKGVVGFDEDDFVYDVFATDEKAAKVYRNRVPDQQLTFGLDAPKAGTYSDLPCAFEVKDGRRTLTLSLRDNDIAPAKLSMERPFALAVMVHDIDSLKDDIHEDPPYSFGKANVCTIPAEDGGAFQNPQHYAWLILED